MTMNLVNIQRKAIGIRQRTLKLISQFQQTGMFYASMNSNGGISIEESLSMLLGVVYLL